MVEVDGVRHTAEHVVVATGADPIIPPVPGLRELEGIWTNREVTGMKAVPRRLLVLGGGPVGVEMAQAVRRLGGEVALVEGAAHVLPREPEPLGEALGEVLRRDGIELALGVAARPPRDATARSTCSSSTTAASCAATGCSSPPAGVRASTASASRRSASKPTPRGIPVDARLRAGDRLWAIGDVDRHLAADPRRQVPGRGRRGEHPRRAARGQLRGRAARRSTPTRRRPRSAPTEAAFSATVALSRRWRRPPPTRAPTPTSNGFMTLLSDGERLTGAYALGPEAGEWLQQATLAIRARVPLDVLRDTIQPFPTFSEIYVAALKALRREISPARQRVGAGGPEE